MESIELLHEDVQWALETARSSLARWENQQGYYNNRLNSHFKGKLGELAVEKFLAGNQLKFDPHFRFADRENLADLVVKIRGYTKIVRIEVKTWSAHYWQELGRCIAVEQFADLSKKADVVFWCQTDLLEIPSQPAPVRVTLCGWSSMADVQTAPVKWTGLDKMRKVQNYQLPEADVREMSAFLASLR